MATEEQTQAKCFIWFWNTFHSERQMLFHVDNNSVNNIIGAKKKALGVVSGVSDFIFICDCEVIFIEMKTRVGVQKVKQKEFQEKVDERGHRYVIIRSEEEFKNYIYGKLRKL